MNENMGRTRKKADIQDTRDDRTKYYAATYEMVPSDGFLHTEVFISASIEEATEYSKSPAKLSGRRLVDIREYGSLYEAMLHEDVVQSPGPDTHK